ncbi:MAG: hypothetical protein ACIAS6_08550 [Phycisphaerales bacterium JB060]
MNGSKSTVPGGDRASLQFTEDRKQLWTDNAALIGLSPEDAAALSASSAAAQSALDLRVAAVNTAKARTVTWHNAAEENRSLAQDLVRKIRGHAVQQADPDAVYAAAQIDPPKTPGELPAPEVPTNLKISLDTEGRAVLTFDSTRYGGTTWRIQRRIVTSQGAITPWASVDWVLERKFVDQATPSGVAGVHYRVRAERPSGISAFSTPVALPFGAGGNQQATAGAIAPPETSGKEAG